MKKIYECSGAEVRVSATGKVSIDMDLVLVDPGKAKTILDDAREAIVKWQLDN